MGNREALLAAARECLLERGYANTSARDIASAAGVSLAAIGYHFGTKENLLAQAATEAVGDKLGAWIDATIRAIAPEASIGETFARFCGMLPQIFAAQRAVLLASAENVIRTARAPELSDFAPHAIEQSNNAMAQILRDVHRDLDSTTAAALAKTYMIAINGAFLIWLASPDAMLTEREATRALSVL
jgi:AcrR family transcriptional regulator